jgi:hypothetical protein
MPDPMTAKATMKVRNGWRKARLTKRAAPPACGYLGDELRIGEGREERQRESDEEGGPDGAAHLRADLADERVEDVAEDEEEQHPPADGTAKRPFLVGAGNRTGLGGRALHAKQLFPV